MSSVLIMLKYVENCVPRYPPKRVPWARCQKILKFIRINFFKKANKIFLNKAKELYCNATIFVFLVFIIYLPKKNGN